MRSLSTWLALGLILALAFLLRSLAAPMVFPGDGSVLLEQADGAYHARRAFYSFVNFPAVLWFDPLINHPDGATVPMPPLYDWALAALARLFGDSRSVFERVLAWISPLLGALTVLPVFAATRSLASRPTALAAAALYAVLLAGAQVARVGNPDHHAAVALLGATLLAVSMGAARAEVTPRRTRALALAGAGTLAALALSWSGSLLYLGIAEAALLSAGVLEGRPALLRAQAAAALGAALLCAPFVVAGGTPHGGALSTLTLSWFHVLALGAAAAVAGAMALAESRRPAASVAARAVRAGVLSGALLTLALALPPVQAALAPSLAFLAKQDAWMASEYGILEARSLLGNLQSRGVFFYGYFVYLLPLAIGALALRLREPRLRGPAAVATVWALGLGAVATAQLRFTADFAPVACLAFALLLASAHAAVVARLRAPRAATAGVVALGIALSLPCFTRYHGTELPWFVRWLRGPDWLPEFILEKGPGSAWQFAESLRRLTPETPGFLDASRPAAYAILAPPSLGHLLHYAARRATPADNFGHLLDPRKLDAVRGFYAAASEGEAVAIAESLDAPFVVTSIRRLEQTGVLAEQLHRADGNRWQGHPRLSRLRLVSEGPQLTDAIGNLRGEGLVPFKLWEIVPGAQLAARAAPGTSVRLECRLRTPLGRRLRYRAEARAGPDGVALLRVPYPTTPGRSVAAEGLHRVWIDEALHRVEVSEAQVREGGRVEVGG